MQAILTYVSSISHPFRNYFFVNLISIQPSEVSGKLRNNEHALIHALFNKNYNKIRIYLPFDSLL